MGDASAFKRDLADVRLTQAEADRRTQEMLGAVQDTIDRLADRLTNIETEARSERTRPAPAAVPVVAPPRMPAAAPLNVAPPVAPQPLATAPQPIANTVAAAPAPVRPAIDPSLPANHPLEPGSIVPRGRPATPAERIAASEAALAPRKPNGGPEANEKGNFIAAARRAAQAAAAEAGQPKRGDDKAAAPEADEAAEGNGAKFKRPLLLSVAAAVLVIGATHVTLSWLGSSGTPAIEAPARADASGARSSAKPAIPASPIDTAAKPAGAPVPNSQLLAPTSVSNLFGPPPAPRQEANAANLAAANTAAAGAAMANAGDITGPLPKREDNAPTAATTAAADACRPPSAARLRTAAVGGNAAAEYEIALRYAEGRGIARASPTLRCGSSAPPRRASHRRNTGSAASTKRAMG